MNPYRDCEDNSFVSAPHVTYEDVATKLLKDNYFLTALELHTELVESGKELPQLREFFSNPGNFEQHVSKVDISAIHRTPSQATLDSLDTTRYSEDGGGDRGGSGGDVAVLEFELRKARETINALRANLTQFADTDSPLDKISKDSTTEQPLKPHEKRALNFLINEYLLLQDYKLTSITFSDENPDQDFEDWDDVGLNIPRPSGLSSLFWGNKSSLKIPTCSVGTDIDFESLDVGNQTELLDYANACSNCEHGLDNDGDWHHEVLVQAEEIRLLKEKVIALETEKLNFQKLYDAAIVSLNSLTSPTSDAKCLELTIPEEKLKIISNFGELPLSEPQPLTLTATDNHYGSNTHSSHSGTPDQFELIDNEKSNFVKKEDSIASSFDPAVLCGSSARDSPLRRGSVTTLDEALSINDGGEWTRLQYDYPIDNTSKDMWIDSGIPNSLKVHLLNWCCETVHSNEPIANELLTELVNSEKPVTLQGLLNLVADTIPKVIPHTLVSRRCELAALTASAVHLLTLSEHSDASRRARLLHSLLTLKKSPDAADTHIICQAVCLIVKWGSSGEVLSCIAELLSSRSAERRVLASQICLSIAPYVSLELCTSLLLSLVVLMCEATEVEIRSLGLKAACLVTPVAEHKYIQLESILFSFLRDPSESIVKDTVSMFVPILARTALIAAKFTSDLMCKIIANLLKLSNDKEWKSVVLYLKVLKILSSAILAFVTDVQIIKDVTRNICDSERLNYEEICLEKEQNTVLDMQCYISDSSYDGKMFVIALNCLIKEKPDVRWAEVNWFIALIKQLLDIAVCSKCLNHDSVYEEYITLISSYIESFGSIFTTHILKPIFIELISDLEYKMEKLHTISNDSTIVVGIYLVAVLPLLNNKEEFSSFLHKWIVYGGFRNLPVKLFSVPLVWVSRHKTESLHTFLQALTVLMINEQGSEGGIGVASRILICEVVSNLANDGNLDDVSVTEYLLPAIVSALHHEDIMVRESAISAWGSVTSAAGPAAAAACWAAGGLQAAAAAGGRASARAARALASLVLQPAAAAPAVCEPAVSMICALSSRVPLSSETLGALLPPLQLVVLHARRHPALPAALRRLEEGVQDPSLVQYRGAVEALSNTFSTEATREPPPRVSNLQTAHEVGRRVTQIFQQSKTNMNLQNIFKKKT